MPALYGHPLPSATAVPNVFLEEYMPQANGEFVKVYLYVLKKSTLGEGSFSLTEMADFFTCTETDIIRALRYWEKAGLISLNFVQGEAEPSGLTLLPVLTAEERKKQEEEALARMEREREEAFRIAYEKRTMELEESKRQSAASAPTASSRGPIGVSSTRAAELAKNDDIQAMLFATESYFGRPLSSTEINRILYFYDELHFGLDLVEYLVEYCVSKGHANIRYLEKVGLSWHQNGITTVEQAKQESNTWEKEYFTILKAFGIRNRNPVPSEADCMNKWLKDFGFSMELIREACQRTITQTGQPSFAYADKILSTWKKNGVKTLSDIHELDARYQQTRRDTASKLDKTSTDKNRFNNFQQRDYDYSDLEKQLLEN